MFRDHKKFFMARFAIVLALLGMMLGMSPVRPAYADSIMVTNTNDSGSGSLRQAIFDATYEPGPAFGDTIKFDPSLAGQTITLTTQLGIDQDLTIDGSGLNPPVVLSGGDTSRIMQIIFFANVTISNLTFTQGVSSDDGGAIEVIQGGDLTLENCTFYQNEGGAINTSGSGDVTIVNSTFDQNQGRAVTASGTVDVTIMNSIFTNNSTGGSGGAISAYSLTLIDSTLSGNIAGGDGGAIYASNLVMKNTTIDQNQADSRGGAIALVGNGPGIIANSTVFKNQASAAGGAIMSQGNAVVEIFNSTFAVNTASIGKEVWLSGNTSLDLQNTIFVCTTGAENCYFGSPISGISTDHSILGIGLLTDYGLAELADNGGITQTMALLPGSPLIDAGDDAVCANEHVNSLDQRGAARPQGSQCDIGAYEDQSLIRYVKQGATGTGDGSSWTNAHTDLQAALAAASPDEEIWVAAGTYKPTSTTDRAISFQLQNGVSVFGGFSGTETARLQRDYENNPTILSGDIGVQGDQSDNSYHVVVADHTNTSAWLDGFTVTGGNADDAVIDTGGGMDVVGGSPGLAHVIFYDNYATFGGGMHVTGDPPILVTPILTDVTFHANSAVEGGGMRNFEFSHPILTNVIFDGNSVTSSGGGMENFHYSNPALTNVIFRNNTAGDAGVGGGMYNWVGNIPILMNVTFLENTAHWGGGMGNYQSNPILRNVVFDTNSASWYGGGMSNEENSNPSLTDVTFDGNTAESDSQATAAGAMHNRSSSPILRNVTFSDNSANYLGGGMVNELGSSPDLVNVTFSGNSADYGGAMLNRDSNSNPTLTHVTMSQNIALGQGGGLANTGTPVITNSILWGNTGGEIYNIFGAPVITYSIVQGGHAGTGNLDEDPLIGPLQDNGGFTQTMALGDGSPAINTAEDTNCPDIDQRGVTRPLGSHCDMGAYEYDNSTIEVMIGGSHMDSYLLAPQESRRVSYPGMNSGPVKLTNTDNASIMAAERVIYKVNGVNTSFSEMMGLPANQLDTTYWLPWYNNVDLDTQLRFANVSASPATVQVYIGDQEMTGSPFTLAVGESTRRSFPGVNEGPVKIVSDVDIVAAERVIYKVNGVNTSFSEMMALPDNQLDAIYWLPWYNNVDLDTQLRIANVSGSPATVTVTIGGAPQPSFNLAAGESTRLSYPGVNNGPVKIVSTHGVPIVAAERVIYKVNGKNTSFSEMMALPDGQLDTAYWLPWYNNVDLDTQLRFANTTNAAATVHVFIGEAEMTGSPFTLLPGESVRKSFASINNGPVKIVSDVPIVAAERVIYKVSGVNTSFSELMGLPNALLDATFWFPWYNNVDLDTQLRFGLP
jgi:predicted outer membrane repeat protein